MKKTEKIHFSQNERNIKIQTKLQGYVIKI